MGVNLFRLKDDANFRWAIYHWPAVLELAEKYGWKPAGTIRCRPSDLQNFTDEDAENMADALECALPDIPSEDAIEEKQYIKVKTDTTTKEFFDLISKAAEKREKNGKDNVGMIVGAGFTLEQWNKLNCFEKFANCKPKLEWFIAYLRGGGCEIR